MENIPNLSVVRLLPPPPAINLIGNPRQTPYPECAKCGLIFKKKLICGNIWRTSLGMRMLKGNLRIIISVMSAAFFFKTSKAYMQHLGKVHSTGNKNSICQVCGKYFKSKHAVKFHARQVHEKATRANCPLCGKQFYSKYLIPPHMLKCEMKS